jgi:hypothetical protein
MRFNPLSHFAPSALKLICVVDDPGALPLAITFHAFSVKNHPLQNRER